MSEEPYGNCLILTVVWASENTASIAYVRRYMFRKTFGGWGMGAHIASHSPLFKGRRRVGEWRGGKGRGMGGEGSGIITRIGDMTLNLSMAALMG